MIRQLILIAAFACADAALSAEPRTIDAPSGAPWKHKTSGVTFPDELAGLKRTRVRDFSTGEWDVASEWNSPDNATTLTIYVYQAAMQDVAVWFAEARTPVEQRRQAYGSITPRGEPVAFAPNGAVSASALKLAYDADGPYRGTALAVAPLGRDWIVKYRLSSRTGVGNDVAMLLDRVVSALALPQDKTVHPAVRPVASCSTTLPQLTRAKVVKSETASAMFGGLFGTLAAKDEKSATVEPLCRDATLSSGLNVYRTDNASRAYWIAVGDSGRAIRAEPDVLAMLLSNAKSSGSVKPTTIVNFVIPGETVAYASFDRLPPPSQALEIVNSGQWMSATKRDGEGSITVNAKTLK